MDHGGQFGMGDTNLCDNLAASSVNLNEFPQTQSKLASEIVNVGQQVSKAPFNNYENDEQNKPDKDVCTAQLEEDQDEVMKEEEEDNSEESNLICCQSPETPMTDSSYSETGSLLETPFVLSPGTSPEPNSPLALIDGPHKHHINSALDLGYSNTELSITKSAISSSEQYTSSSENVLDYNLTPKIGPSSVAEEKTLQYVSFDETELFSHCSGSGEPSFAEMETSKPSCITETNIHQEPSQLLGFLDQLSKRGDDACLPLYLHQIAEAFVSHEDFQRAIWCIQLERLYHQRLLDNLSALQTQWETQCKSTSSALTSQHLDSLKQTCLTHSRPKASHAVFASLDHLVVPSCSSDCQDKGTMERLKRDEKSSGSSLLSHSIDLGDKIDSSEVAESDQEDSISERKDSFHQAQSNEEEHKAEEPEGGPEGTMSAQNGISPSDLDDMDQSKTAEQQEGGLNPAQQEEAHSVEQRDVEEATEALEMDDEEEGEEEGRNGKAFTFCPETLPVETIVSAAAVEIRLQESRSETEETQQSPEDSQDAGAACLSTEMLVPEDDLNQLCLDVGKEEEEEDYEVDQADLFRAAATLDELAKLITVEQLTPAPGLVSILKRRAACKASPTSAGPQPQCNKLPGKRRVRFKVPDDGFDNDMGGGDSCLLLFLLCLVTVVISVGGTALYCALGDTNSSVCQDFSRNAEFYFGRIQRGISQIQHWFTPTL
ncbi:consortin [Eucyclogobius newberryi]|uniref:consortin n=1 Tax=Eucyclogobius newberryi TaxID=166745 RepID=UPI003B59F69A